jgi:predicted ATPase
VSASTLTGASSSQPLIRSAAFSAIMVTGALLLRQNDSKTEEAQNCFRRAIGIARKQSAKSFELRAAMSLVRLLAKQNRREEARAKLVEIYGRFTEGFDSADLKDAKSLLDELAG